PGDRGRGQGPPVRVGRRGRGRRGAAPDDVGLVELQGRVRRVLQGARRRRREESVRGDHGTAAAPAGDRWLVIRRRCTGGNVCVRVSYAAVRESVCE
ncbi:hypothetical protein ZWY2020_006397, partial [Hordeum vulgare]